jgi:hypothetical protein
MSQMSPLLVLILKAIRVGVLGVSAFMLVFLGLGLWQKNRTVGLEMLTRHDYTFFAILLLLCLAGLWMARSISREIRKSGT